MLRFLLLVVAASACGRVGFDVPDHGAADADGGPCATPVVLRPLAPGPNTDWPTQVPAMGDHVDRVREVEADDDATYIASNIDGSRDEFTHAPSGISATATIDAVTVWVRGRAESVSTNQELAPALTSGLPVHQDRQPSLQYDNYSASFPTNPSGAPWTVASVDAMTFGVRKSYAFTTVRVTQVWAEVTCHE